MGNWVFGLARNLLILSGYFVNVFKESTVVLRKYRSNYNELRGVFWTLPNIYDEFLNIINIFQGSRYVSETNLNELNWYNLNIVIYQIIQDKTAYHP